MSDDQLENERSAQFHLKMLKDDVRRHIRAINAYSTLENINMGAWDDFVHDWLPNEANWEEKIREVRS